MSKVTIYSKACYKVIGFQQMSEEFIRKLVIDGKSKSTHQNYVRQMAKLAIHYGRSPLDLSIEELEEYLYFLIQRDTDALSSYKHLVYGLRKLYQLYGKEELQLALPRIDRDKKLPVVLSKKEVKLILSTAVHIREKVMFGLTYDTGLRISELANLMIRDADLDRGLIHVRKGKGKKDRYIPMSALAIRGIKKHIAINSPKVYLFENLSRRAMPISHTKIRNLLNDIVSMTDIKKNITVHSLRHTYATHQLEAGQNIMVLKDLLGHSVIETTLIYLQVSQVRAKQKFGCLEVLYGKTNE
jgi:site-specific recombinase XerD